MMDGHKDVLKVLLVSPLPPPSGGIATWTKKYVNWTKGKNIHVDIVNTAVVGTRLDKINSRRKLLDEAKRTKDILKELIAKLNCNSANIAHINTSCGAYGVIRDYIFAKIIKKKGISLIVHYHCNIEDQVKNRKIQKKFFQMLSKTADINLVLNKSSQKYIKVVS
ncbi:hypothetical protein V7068_20070, partial [Bacillus sp. JJ634]